jgi:ketosteroid isomerase-like protein
MARGAYSRDRVMLFEKLLSNGSPGLSRDEIVRRVKILAAKPSPENDFRAIRDLFSADVVCEFVGDKSRISYAGRHVGVDALIAIIRNIVTDFEQLNHSISEIIVDGGRVAIRRSVEWRHRGTGRRGRVDLADFVRFEDGLIVEMVEFRDSIAILSMQGEPSWP